MDAKMVKIVIFIAFFMKSFSSNGDHGIHTTKNKIIGIGCKMCENYCNFLSTRCLHTSYSLADLSCELVFYEQIILSWRSRCSKDCGPVSACILNKKGREICIVVSCIIDEPDARGLKGYVVEVGYVRSDTNGQHVCRPNGLFSRLQPHEKEPNKPDNDTLIVYSNDEIREGENGMTLMNGDYELLMDSNDS